MDPYFLVAAGALIFSGQAVSFKLFSSNYLRGLASYFLNNIIYLGAAVLICMAVTGMPAVRNVSTYFYAAAFGVLFVVSTIFYFKAMSMGPTGLVALFFSFGIVIPIIVDVAALGSATTAFQVLGLALLFASFYIGNRPSRSDGKSISPKFIAVCVMSLILNGVTMVAFKLHQAEMPGVDAGVFVIFGFTTAVVTSALCFLVCHLRQRKNGAVSYKYIFCSAKYYVSLSGSSLTTAVGNLIMLQLASRLPAAIQFPLINGGSSLIAAALSVFIFREKLTAKAALTFTVGLAALVLVNL